MGKEKLSFKLDAFEGPLDLLLHLIEKNKVDIYDIPILEITGQYLVYINKLKELDLEISSEFLIIASQLLYIKSKMLLPKVKKEDEDDPRTELVLRLLDYQAYKKLAEFLKEKETDGEVFYYREQEKFDFTKRDILNQTFNLPELVSAFYSVVNRNEQKKKELSLELPFRQMIKRRVYIIGEMMILLSERLKREKQICFTKFFCDCREKSECIGFFLAILEMIKNGQLHLNYSFLEKDYILNHVSVNTQELNDYEYGEFDE